MGKLVRFFDKTWKRLNQAKASGSVAQLSRGLRESGVKAGELYRSSREELEDKGTSAHDAALDAIKQRRHASDKQDFQSLKILKADRRR